MQLLFSRWVEIWVSKRAWSGEDVRRGRLSIRLLSFGLFGNAVSGVGLGVMGLTPSVIGSLVLTAVWAGCLWALRRGVSTTAVAHTAIGAFGVSIAIPFLMQAQFEPDALAWAVLMPQMGALMVGRRGLLAWAFGAMALAVLAVVLHPLLPHASSSSSLASISTARLLLLVFLNFLLGFQFDRESGRAQHAVMEATRARSAFLATVSHEIRTPMNGVLGMTEVMLQGANLTDETREQLSLIQRSGQSLVALINDILDFSKVEAGKLRLELIDFDLIELMGDLQQLFEQVAQQKGVGLDLTTMNGVPRLLRGDALRLRQVLNNLVNNAVKFTDRGSVSLRARCVETIGSKLCVQFEVQDTGIGIAPEVLPKLFRLFEQGDVGTTRRYGGTGLGLALSQQLAVLMGGELKVVSTHGQGSTFSFMVWFEKGVQAMVDVGTDDDRPLVVSSRPVLVVDDNAINLRVACGLLHKAGYATESATNGQQAFDMVKAQRYALVLMDCHMPVMDGFEATERIRGLDGDVAMTPIIALTASALPEELEACRRAGMNECLTKPVSYKTLRHALKQVARYQAILDQKH